MDSSIDLYSFAGDTAGSGEGERRKCLDAGIPLETRTGDSLHQDAYQAQNVLPPVAPDRHRHNLNVLDSKDGRPIIIEYNNIFINTTGKQNPPEGPRESSQNQCDIQTSSPYNVQSGQPYATNLPDRTDQAYPPSQPADTVYGAYEYSVPGGYGGFRRPPETVYNRSYENHPGAPHYSNHSRYPGYANYSEYPNDPGYRNYSAFQNYPDCQVYSGYQAFPNRGYDFSSEALTPKCNNGKFNQIISVLREMGPLAFDITALTTARRGFHHYPGAYVPQFNYSGWNNNLANTVGINPYGVPVLRY